MRFVASLCLTLLVTAPVSAADAGRIDEIINDRCAHCHGAQGDASSAIYPRLAGQHRVYLAKQLRNFRDGARQSDTMNEMVKDLGDEEIMALAEFYSGQPVRAHRIRTTKKDLEAVGYYIYHKGNEYTDIPPCTSCHGAYGEGSETLPRLAGQHKRYIVAQLEAFHERKRTNDNAIMFTIAKELTELEINAVALYVSGLKPGAGAAEPAN